MSHLKTAKEGNKHAYEMAKKFKALRFIRSFAKFTCIKLRPYLKHYQSFEVID